MKHFFLTGGFLGFFFTFVIRFTAGGDLHMALRDGMIGCLLMAFLCRFFYRQLEIGALEILRREAEEERQREELENSD